MDRIYLNNLFDVYQNMLTDHEQEVFINYFHDKKLYILTNMMF